MLGRSAAAYQGGKIVVRGIRRIRCTIGHQYIDFAASILCRDCKQVAVTQGTLVSCLASIQRLGTHLESIETCAFCTIDVVIAGARYTINPNSSRSIP